MEKKVFVSYLTEKKVFVSRVTKTWLRHQNFLFRRVWHTVLLFGRAIKKNNFTHYFYKKSFPGKTTLVRKLCSSENSTTKKSKL